MRRLSRRQLLIALAIAAGSALLGAVLVVALSPGALRRTEVANTNTRAPTALQIDQPTKAVSVDPTATDTQLPMVT